MKDNDGSALDVATVNQYLNGGLRGHICPLNNYKE
jgi:hypothetical protein